MIPIRYNVRSLLERRATSVMTTLGVAMVAMIFVILFGFVGGLKSTLLRAGNNNNWIVLERGALSENSSGIAREQSEVVRILPEIALTPDGKPLISPELIVGVNVSPDNRVKQFALLRGVTPLAYEVHRGMRIVTGRWPVRGSEDLLGLFGARDVSGVLCFFQFFAEPREPASVRCFGPVVEYFARVAYAADMNPGRFEFLAPAGQTDSIVSSLIDLGRNSPNQIEHMEGHVGMTEQMGYVSETFCIFQAVRCLPIPDGPVVAFSAKHSFAGSMDI